MNKYRNIFGSCDCEQGESAQPRVAAEQAIRAAIEDYRKKQGA